MDNMPDYSKYTSDELKEALTRIDKEKNEELARRVLWEIETREYAKKEMEKKGLEKTKDKGSKSRYSGALAIVFLVIGLIMFTIGVIVTFATIGFVNNASEANGRIVELIEHTDAEGTTYAPVFTFETAEGDIITKKSNTSSNPPGFRIGETVEVLYDPDNPRVAKIKSFSQLWFFSIFLGGMGIIFVIVGWKNSHFRKSDRQREPLPLDKEQFPDDDMAVEVVCQECNTNIPVGETKCPSCGWSYKVQSDT